MSDNKDRKDVTMAKDAQLKARLPKPPSGQCATSDNLDNGANSEAAKKSTQ